MLRPLRYWLRAPSLAKRAAGPFSPEFFSALKSNACMYCGGLVPDMSIFFGNALVVEPRLVVLKCRKCRGGGGPKQQVDFRFGTCDVDGVIYEVHHHKHDDGFPIDWFEILLCLRKAFAYVQSKGFHEPPTREAFIGSGTRPTYGDLPSIGNCGECGAFWTNTPFPQDTGWKMDESWNETECYHCGLKHELQWHMRISYSEEKKILTGG